jgi:serine/threonine protein kinase
VFALILQYQLFTKLGGGSYGNVYSGKDLASGLHVAVKIENINTNDPRLEIEYRRYLALNHTGFVPHVYWIGIYASEYRVIVMDRLGPTLDQFRKKYHSRYAPLAVVVNLGERLVGAVEAMHAHSIVHRDIKPHNMATRYNAGGAGVGARVGVSGILHSGSLDSSGSGENSHIVSTSGGNGAKRVSAAGIGSPPTFEVYLIDFGSSKLYQQPNIQRQHPVHGVNQQGGPGVHAMLAHQYNAHKLNNHVPPGNFPSNIASGGQGEESLKGGCKGCRGLGSHIKYREEKGFIGTVKFASMAALTGAGMKVVIVVAVVQ